MGSVIPNGVGVFEIGVSPIGTRPILDYVATLMSQYANSATLTQLIADFDENIDPTANLDMFFDTLWNVETAQSYGLDVWGRIVGVVRTLNVTSKFFGFEEAGILSADPFYQSPFYSGSSSSNYSLSDDAFRVLIYAKALANISNGSIPSLNQILLNLFPGRGVCYVTDPGNMTMEYVFEFEPTPVEMAILTQSGVLPRPCGVSASVVLI